MGNSDSTCSVVRVIVFACATVLAAGSAPASPPDIDVWYGSNQRFGHVGNPQSWCNILGNVSDPDGVSSLVYTLNGGPERVLSLGPDSRRLADPGDFNIDIAVGDLLDGANQIVITATDSLNNPSVDNVTLEYSAGNTWPLADSIDWSLATRIDDVAQVVDGLWSHGPAGVRTSQVNYDRLIAIGDLAWTDYEITVPITVHGLVLGGPSGPPGVGLLVRWTGHTDDPISGTQPKSGYIPFGAIAFCRWNGSGTSANLQFYQTGASESFTPVWDVPYIWKLRVQSTPGLGGLYSLKVWEEGLPEPSEWNLTDQAGSSNLSYGSFLLLAHHVDATFGNVTVSPTPLSIGNIGVTLGTGGTSATISWTTNQPADSSVSYGLTPSYELGTVSDTNLVTQHEITLTGLTSDTEYHYEISSTPSGGAVATSGDRTFMTTISDIVSDDFACGIDTDLWMLVDPVGDAVFDHVGSGTEDAWLTISIPAGTDHDVWTAGNRAPRLMQAALDTDFELEAKYDSVLTEQYQMIGLVIEESTGNYVRGDFYFDGSQTRIFAATFINDTPTVRNNSIIPAGSPLYMRWSRQGDGWTQSYSYDGQQWTTAVSFTHSISVASVGPFVGNAIGASSPAHTGAIDYVLNTASPLATEDDVTDTDGDGMTDPCDRCPNRKPGDVSDDAVFDAGDIGPFVGVLLEPGIASSDALCAADMNADSNVDGLDVQPFVEALIP